MKKSATWRKKENRRRGARVAEKRKRTRPEAPRAGFDKKCRRPTPDRVVGRGSRDAAGAEPARGSRGGCHESDATGARDIISLGARPRGRRRRPRACRQKRTSSRDFRGVSAAGADGENAGRRERRARPGNAPWMRRVASPPSSTMMSRGSEPQSSILSVHHQYSSRVSPFQANTAAESRATAAAAWSWVEKMLHEHQRTTAPSATRVSMSTAVWMVMWSEPEMLAPLRGWAGPNSLIMDMRPGISTCASSISRRLRVSAETAEAGARVSAARRERRRGSRRFRARFETSRARRTRSARLGPTRDRSRDARGALRHRRMRSRYPSGAQKRDPADVGTFSRTENAPEVGHGHVLDLVLATVEGLDGAHSGRGRHLDRGVGVNSVGGVVWCGKVTRGRAMAETKGT